MIAIHQTAPVIAPVIMIILPVFFFFDKEATWYDC